jgi:ATP-dependent Clp protease ATP-binding subunit ClpC
MQMPICSRCKKNVAVVFISKVENGVTTQEGLCLKCAKELGIKPVDNLMESMGITEDDLDAITGEMANFGKDMPEDFDMSDVDEDPGQTKSFPFLDKLFGSAPMGFGGSTTEESGENADTGDKPKKEKKDKKRKFLSNYCDNLSRKAKEGKLDNVIGRDEETRRVIQILNRRQKNNPCLIGEPGVGKTAIAEGLALRIARGDVPYKLKNKEVYLLDLTALVAGTQFRGQFESRIKGLVEEIKNLGNIILVIDEVHNIVGAGDAEGSMNAANILKPALSRGEIQVIGATTYAEYRKYIEKDAALERRFQPVTVAEPSIADTETILKGIRGYYETFHGVTMSDEICHQAALLSERYITDRFLPDKAIDLIDEACSQKNLSTESLNEIPRLQDALNEINNRKNDLMQGEQSDQTYQELAELRSQELTDQNKLDELLRVPAPELTTEDLARVIELWTGIPATKICASESARLLGLEDRLRAHVVGQDEAIDAVAAAIRRNRAGISPRKRPVSFIFVGPTAVGKTELVKTLANDLFDSPEALIRLDMSEYMEKHTVSRLIGSPPGYVGYDEAGQLTEKVRRRPYCVILLDEIEKAHPDIFNILLQILDDGRLTDSHGRRVSFENTVIVMTSNAGSDRNEGVAGFGGSVSEHGHAKAMKALSQIMRPEFLNRISEVIAFNQLTEENFVEISKIMLGELTDSLAEKNIRFSYDEKVPAYLAHKSFSLRFGARNLRRLIEKDIEDTLARTIIESGSESISGAHITVEDEKIKAQII